MLRSGFASCRFGKLGLRACATAAASAKVRETAAPAGDVLPNELAEHEAFLKFCHERGKLSVRALAIRSTCSSSRNIRTLDGPRAVIHAKAAYDQALQAADGDEAAVKVPHVSEEAFQEAVSKYDFRGMRGLVVTEDVDQGFAFMRAPVADFAINVATMAKAHEAAPDQYRGDSAAAAVFRCMPDAQALDAITRDMMVRDHFYHHQLLLATHLAWERCDAGSPFATYLNTLPVPAIDDTVVQTVHAGGLSTLQSIEYNEYHQDFLFAIKRIRASWVAAVERLSVDAELKKAALARVPPIQVLDWAWRTVLGRQLPVPFMGIAPGMECFRGATNRSINYTQWFELQQAQHALAPSLVPMFELIDHDATPNCEIDVLMRPVLKDGTVDHAVTDEFIALLHEREHLFAKVTKTRKFSIGERRKTGYKNIIRVLNNAKQLADKAQRAIVGETGGTAVEGDDPLGLEAKAQMSDSDARKSERKKRRDDVTRRLDEIEDYLQGANVQPVLELRATQPITAGTPLGVHFALLHSRSFTLYRFGFEPV